MTLILYYIYLGILGLSSLTAGLRFRGFGKSFRFLALFIWCTFLTELIAYWAALYFENNYVVYNIYTFFEFALICLYFNYSVDLFRKYNLGYYIGVLGWLLNLVDVAFLESWNSGNTYFISVETIAVVWMALYSIYRLLIFHPESRLSNNLHYTIAFLFILGWLTTFFHWGLNELVSRILEDRGIDLQTVVLCIFIAVYLVFAWVFWMYPKFNKTE